ncbi:hypothetical protein OsJ_33864 [Oryza sativa Japonica Group]|uniref:Uncharacterized protein n=1 Tax=Oryza sativa subsp. japonica TaxID=39947 RepID=B9GAM7_ORYSJ|nr:hypothetical protein OsJ_33864 [Oryza sativa Japonica Group]
MTTTAPTRRRRQHRLCVWGLGDGGGEAAARLSPLPATRNDDDDAATDASGGGGTEEEKRQLGSPFSWRRAMTMTTLPVGKPVDGGGEAATTVSNGADATTTMPPVVGETGGWRRRAIGGTPFFIRCNVFRRRVNLPPAKMEVSLAKIIFASLCV